MKNLINENKGITLIALIITIIVMLILAGISISAIVGEDGIIARAEYAKEEQRGATVQEHRDLWKSSINTDQLSGTSSAQTLDEVVEDLKIELITEEEAEKIINEGYVEIGSRKIVFWDKLMVGDYVDYHPDKVTESYDKLEEKYTGATENTEFVGQDNSLRWRILNINEDTVDLISDDVVEYKILFRGPIGFNNGVAILNDYCKKMYSNNSIGAIARCINIKDIEDKLILNPVTRKKASEMYKNYDNNKYYGEEIKLTGGSYYYPEKLNSDDGIIKEYASKEEAIKTQNNSISVTQTFWKAQGNPFNTQFLEFEKRNSENEKDTYWEIFCLPGKGYSIASTYCSGSSNEIAFGVFGWNPMYENLSDADLYLSSGLGNLGAWRSPRPIITLPKDAINVDLDYDTEVGWKIKSNY